MLGLVLWVRKGCGMIWCEDQDDLVYFSIEGLDDFPVDPLKMGDFVRFECRYSYGRRIASTIELLAQNSFGESLSSILMAQAKHATTQDDTAQEPPIDVDTNAVITEFPRAPFLADEPQEPSKEGGAQCVDVAFLGRTVKAWAKGGNPVQVGRCWTDSRERCAANENPDRATITMNSFRIRPA